MKILTVQNSSPICSRGFIKTPKAVPVNIMNNPTEEVLKEAEARMQKQIEDLGLVVIKEVKFIQKVKN